MSIGNWRNHTLVNCKVCLKPMGYHNPVDGATCVDCENLALESVDCEDLNAVPARHLKEVPKYPLRRVRTKLFRSMRGVK